jgi:hypothetical protein
MTLTDRILLWRKKRAIKRHDTAGYFALVSKIAKREAIKMANEKLKQR